MTIRDIEDNYPHYLDDTLGYSFGAWDFVRAQDRVIHDRILGANSDELSGFDPKALPDIAIWALARRHSETSLSLDAFESLVVELVKSVDPCLDHLGIATFAMRQMIRLDQDGRAKALLDKLEPLENDKELWSGLLSRKTDPESSVASLNIWIDKDSRPIEAILDIVENLINFGDYQSARWWLEEANKRATEASYSPALVDIELLRTSIQDE